MHMAEPAAVAGALAVLGQRVFCQGVSTIESLAAAGVDAAAGQLMHMYL